MTGGGEGNNAKASFGWAIDINNRVDVYIAITREDFDNNQAAFRVIRDSYDNLDDFPNYFDEIEAQANVGNYANRDVHSACIDYNGDVDLLAYQSTAGIAYTKLIETEDDFDITINASFYSVPETDIGLDTNLWFETSISSRDSGSHDLDYFVPTSITVYESRYYVEIYQTKASLPSYGNSAYYLDYAYGYAFEFYEPRSKDVLDASVSHNFGNNNPYYATEITTAGYTNDALTLHIGDIDYFKFTTGNENLNVKVDVNCKNVPYRYSPHLYLADDITMTVNQTTGIVSWSGETDLADYSTYSGVSTLTYDGLLPNKTYYVKIKRPNSSSYSSYHKYILTVAFTEPNIPSAILDSNVELSHTIGENITSTDAFKNTVMNSLTCKINDVAVNDSEAITDVELYYNNSPLTATIVNGLSAGTYDIVAKYQDAAATGGTITLTVTEPMADDIVQINVTKVSNGGLEILDWAAAAKMIAEGRLSKEGRAASSMDIFGIAIEILQDNAASTRGTLANTRTAANLVYNSVTGGTSQYNFMTTNLTADNAVNTIYAQIQRGNTVILQLSTEATPTDMNNARYILICGVNRTDNTFYVIDPNTSASGYEEVEQTKILNGGYAGNANLKFTGTIIDFS